MSSDGLERGARASRGKRMSKLLNEELEADDEFWNQEALRDDAEDNEYEAEDEEADVFDSDFDEDEPGEEDFEEDERPQPKKKKPRLGTSAHHEKKKKERKKTYPSTREISSLVEVAAGGDMSQDVIGLPELSQQGIGESLFDVDGERSVRKSTRTSVVIKQAEREAHQAALQALYKPVKKKKEEERKITQEEMLLEAAQTEIQNVQALEIMLAREEEVKRKAIIQKEVYAGPQIRFHSRGGRNILEFTNVMEFPKVFNSRPVPYPKKVLCVITGQPAKYRDPKSNLPYATKEAFKIIRERYNKRESSSRKGPMEESHQRKRTKVERERLGPGGRSSLTKQKYNKVISKISSDDTATRSPIFLKTIESKVLNPEQSFGPTLQGPIDQDLSFPSVIRTDQISGLQLSSNLISHDFSLLDIPGAFLEADEADFMLDDLEVSLASTRQIGLSPPTSMSIPHMLLSQDTGSDASMELLEQRKLGVTPFDENQSSSSLVMSQLSELDGVVSAGKEIL